ncbi:NUDIX domain-containing protein [Candidatus Woesearchaeota archaeon]|nr:NUDIX domain-containing protein [Candidatus Woesearchaeota archaeon]
MDEKKAFYVSVTGIVMSQGRYLIVKRSDKEKAFPGKWTVPGGKVERADYHSKVPNAGGLWYEVLEAALRRELKEEVGLSVKRTGYVTSMAFERPDKAHGVIVSFWCEGHEGEIRLCDALTTFRWVDLEEAKGFDLIEGIYDELVMVDKLSKHF